MREEEEERNGRRGEACGSWDADTLGMRARRGSCYILQQLLQLLLELLQYSSLLQNVDAEQVEALARDSLMLPTKANRLSNISLPGKSNIICV
jgi:hypothetical protein